MSLSKQLLHRATIGSGIAGLLVILLCSFVPLAPPTHAIARAQGISPCLGSGGIPSVSISTTLPVSFSVAGQQMGADCTAWQEFIALNWKADPTQRGYPDSSAPETSYGTSGDTSPKVWESYWEASSVFNAAPARRLLKAPVPKIRKLSRISKQGLVDLTMSDISQAGDGKWLTDQNGNLTYYEVLINQDELDFITQNTFGGKDLTTFAGQAACASSPGQGGKGGFNLPSGGGTGKAQLDVSCTGTPATYGQNVGAIEIKAAWRILPADHSLDYRYKTSLAQVTTPNGGTSQVTVGLVGLHILHKVQGAPQFLWATFEQIDNCPNDGGPYGSGYTYYSSGCDPTKNPYKCLHNALPGTPCDPQGQPAGCDPYSAPMQITRLNPVDSNAQKVTSYVQSQLPAQSVFRYYQLIDVQWPGSPSVIPPQSQVPLSTGNIQPPSSQRYVANCTLETYLQWSKSCMDCHMNAPIAQPCMLFRKGTKDKDLTKVMVRAKTTATAMYGSDYSFVFVSETNH